MNKLVFDLYPRPQKKGDWDTKSHTMQRCTVRAARAYIKRVAGQVPEETKTLDKWTYDPGGMYCKNWPRIEVVTPIVTVDLAAIHMPEFIGALWRRAKKEVAGVVYVHAGAFHVLVITPAQLIKLRKAAEPMRSEAYRLMDEFNAKASPMVRAITEKKANGETVLVGPDGLVEVAQGEN